MSIIEFEGKRISLKDNQSALEALLEAGFDIANSCRAGVCQRCVLAVDEGTPTPQSQAGLSAQQVALKHVLSCQCNPEHMLGLKRIGDAGKRLIAKVLERSWLNTHILRLTVDADLAYAPGQYATLWKDNDVSRCYSIASHPAHDDYLEFHIKYLSDGVFSAWAAKNLNEGDEIEIQGPFGQCIYSGNTDKPLLLVALGTGLAPIWGILQDAVQHEHTGKIDLVVASANANNFYLQKELYALQALHPQNINVTYIAQTHTTNEGLDGDVYDYLEGDVYDYIKQYYVKLDEYEIYICGAQSFVNKLKRQCFMSGASMSNISADPFIAS